MTEYSCHGWYSHTVTSNCTMYSCCRPYISCSGLHSSRVHQSSCTSPAYCVELRASHERLKVTPSKTGAAGETASPHTVRYAVVDHTVRYAVLDHIPYRGKFLWGPNFILCYLQLIRVLNFRSVHFT